MEQLEKPYMVCLGPVKQVISADEGTSVFNKCQWMTVLSESIDSLKMIISYIDQYIKSMRMFIHVLMSLKFLSQ